MTFLEEMFLVKINLTSIINSKINYDNSNNIIKYIEVI